MLCPISERFEHSAIGCVDDVGVVAQDENDYVDRNQSVICDGPSPLYYIRSYR